MSLPALCNLPFLDLWCPALHSVLMTGVYTYERETYRESGEIRVEVRSEDVSRDECKMGREADYVAGNVFRGLLRF